MNCPKCANELKALEGFSFSASKCQGCGGIWFKEASHELAKQLVDAKDIDNSETNSASAYNLIRDVNCPDCSVKMIKMVDPKQLNIELESCPDCYGTFFDAGEFADYSEFTLIERVQKALAAFRTNRNS